MFTTAVVCVAGAAGELGDSEITDDSTCTFSEHKGKLFNTL